MVQGAQIIPSSNGLPQLGSGCYSNHPQQPRYLYIHSGVRRRYHRHKQWSQGSKHGNFKTIISFSLKDLDDLDYLLGVEAHSHPKGLFLNQNTYIQDLLIKVNMADANSLSTPTCPTTSLTEQAGDPLPPATEYRMVLGSLQYLFLQGRMWALQETRSLNLCIRLQHPTRVPSSVS